jgi:DNA (cytosine-5)-methyltransferase 1
VNPEPSTILRHLDLCSGIGGFALAARMAGGIETVAFCEIDSFCRRVLAKNFPGVPIVQDIHDVTLRRLRRHGLERVDIVSAGFPCQPFSSASRGRRRGRDDDRYLWPEVRRIVAEVRPTWVVCENVADIDGLALDEVLSDLEDIDYEVAPPFEIPACAVDADHIRRRVWILGHTDRQGESGGAVHEEMAGMPWDRGDAGSVGAEDGLPGRVDIARLRAVGNAIHPAIAAEIFRAIVSEAGAAA